MLGLVRFVRFCSVYSCLPVIFAGVVLPNDLRIAVDNWSSRFSLHESASPGAGIWMSLEVCLLLLKAGPGRRQLFSGKDTHTSVVSRGRNTEPG